MIAQLILLAGLAVIVMRRPYMGIVILFASLPIAELLPSMAWAGSIFSALGAVTLLSFLLRLLNRRPDRPSRNKIPPISISGLMFIGWILLSNPSSAVTPDLYGRIWLATFFQLWVFSLLTALLFDTPRKIESLMRGFIIASVISAVFAIGQGDFGSDMNISLRAEGLVGGANTAARYFVIALTFCYYFYRKELPKSTNMILTGAMTVLILGTLLTVSRSGLLLLVGSIGMIGAQSVRAKNIAFPIVFVLLSLVVVWFLTDDILRVFGTILPSILQGADTVGIRYRLWEAGIRMWVNQPVAGMGIGRFSQNLTEFGWDLLPSRYLIAGAHNMYVAVLSETGVIGLFIFLGMFVQTIRGIILAIRSDDSALSNLARNWFIVAMVILLGGITKHDHYDKSTWIVLGLGGALSLLAETYKSKSQGIGLTELDKLRELYTDIQGRSVHHELPEP